MVREGEYLFIYNSNKLEDRMAHGYVLSIKLAKINERDIYKDHLTEKQVAEVARKLNLPISVLHDKKNSPQGSDFSDDELVKVLAEDPAKLKTPIILSTKKSFLVGSSYELIKENLEPQ